MAIVVLFWRGVALGVMVVLLFWRGVVCVLIVLCLLVCCVVGFLVGLVGVCVRGLVGCFGCDTV